MSPPVAPILRHPRIGGVSVKRVAAHATPKSTPRLRQINPTGKSILIIRNIVKPRNRKYSRCAGTQISRLMHPSTATRGALAIVTTCGGMRWTRRLRQTSAAFHVRRNRLGPTPRCRRQVRGLPTRPEGDGVTKSRVTRTISYKP